MAHAPVTVSDPDDWRYEALGDAAGYSRTDALGRMVRLWSYCTEKQLYIVSESVVRAHLGAKGVEAIEAAELGERTEGGVRVRGTGGRIEWFAPVASKREKRLAGKARAASARRDPVTGRLLPAEPTPLADHQQVASSQSSTPPAEPRLLDQQAQHATSRTQPSESGSESEISEHTPRAIDIGTPTDQRKLTKQTAWDALHAAWRECAPLVPHPGMRPPLEPVGPVAQSLSARLTELVVDGGEDYPQASAYLVNAVDCAAAKVRRDLIMTHLVKCWDPEDFKRSMAATPAQFEAEIPSTLAIGPAKQRREAMLAKSKPERGSGREEFRPEQVRWGADK